MPDLRSDIRAAFQRRLDAAPMDEDLRRRAAERARRARGRQPVVFATAVGIVVAVLAAAVLTFVAGHPRQQPLPVTPPTPTATPSGTPTTSPSASPEPSASPAPSATPAPPGAPTFTSYALPDRTFVNDIVLGPDGAVWFTEEGGSKIGRMDAAGQVTYPAGLAQWSGPSYITVGPDGAIWFTESGANKIGRLTLAGQLREYTVPTARSLPRGITSGPDGAIWFTEQVGNKIGRLTLEGQFSEFLLPNRGDVQCGNVCPEGIVAGLDGALWFAEDQFSAGGGNRIGRMTTSGQLSEYEIPTQNSRPMRIAAGDGALWFTESQKPRLGRINLDGQITELAMPGGTSEVAAGGVCAGPDHRIVFTVVKAFPGATTGGASIGVASLTGLRLYTVPGETALRGPIVQGPDGTIWALGETRIWKITL